MLGNVDSLVALATDTSYEPKLTGSLQLLQEFRWRNVQAVLKANLLFLFDRDQGPASLPISVLIVEDCSVQLGDDNAYGKEFIFEMRFRATGKNYVFSAEDFKSLERWVTVLSITPMDYIACTKASYVEQIDGIEEKRRLRKEAREGDRPPAGGEAENGNCT